MQPMIPFELMRASATEKPDNAVAQILPDGDRLQIHVDTHYGKTSARAWNDSHEDVTFEYENLNNVNWMPGSYIFDAVVHNDSFAMLDMPYFSTDYSAVPFAKRYKKLEKVVTALNDSRVYLLEASSNIEGVQEYADNVGDRVIVKNLYSEYESGESDEWYVVE